MKNFEGKENKGWSKRESYDLTVSQAIFPRNTDEVKFLGTKEEEKKKGQKALTVLW